MSRRAYLHSFCVASQLRYVLMASTSHPEPSWPSSLSKSSSTNQRREVEKASTWQPLPAPESVKVKVRSSTYLCFQHHWRLFIIADLGQLFLSFAKILQRMMQLSFEFSFDNISFDHIDSVEYLFTEQCSASLTSYSCTLWAFFNLPTLIISVHLFAGVRCSAVIVVAVESTRVYKQSW